MQLSIRTLQEEQEEYDTVLKLNIALCSVLRQPRVHTPTPKEDVIANAALIFSLFLTYNIL